MDSPVIKKKRGISPVWILPLIALSIGGWLLYTGYRDAGIAVTIHFSDAEGITAGKTQVIYRGVAVGKVEKMTVDEDLQGVNLLVNMERKAKGMLVEDSGFWVVKPEISAGRISGLETMLSGSYIAVRPGKSAMQVRRFEGLKDQPILSPDSPGLHISLRAETLYSLQKGSSVYAKNIKIGYVKGYHLAEDGSLLLDLFIEQGFSHLIQAGTRFWNASGLSFEGNLQSGFSLRMQSMAALVYGGISCGTPESLVATSPQATNGMIYQLYGNYEAAEYGLPMTLQLSSGGGIVEGKTKVMYRGLEAGVVKKISLNNDDNHSVTAEILLDPRAEPILRQGTRFWVVRPEVSIDGIRNLETIISGPHLTFMPGDGEFQDHFIVEEGAAPKPPKRSGTHFTLVAEDSGSLETGAPVLYKKMIVGEIRDIAFGAEAKSVRIGILIYDEYAHLVRQRSVFWNVSGVEVDAGLSHFNVNLSSIRAVISGGIAFINPENDSANTPLPAGEGKIFTLYESFDRAAGSVHALRPRGILVRLESSADNSVTIGSPVLYKQIPVGEVHDLALSDDHRKIVFEVLIYEKYAKLVTVHTVFYNYSGVAIDADLSGITIRAAPVAALLAGGIAFFTPENGAAIEEGHLFSLYDDYDAALHRDSITITLRLDTAEGIREKTRITCQGIEIGAIRKLGLAPDRSGIIAEGRVGKEAEHLFRETTRLRLVKPEISLSGVRHLDTVLTGSYIDITPGTGALRMDFALPPQSPGGDSSAGLNLILETSRLGSLNKNSPVYYRQVRVGRVTGFELSPTAQQVWVGINIHPDYANLVRNGSRFWLASGIRASWGVFSGFDLDSESMEAILAGGIAFATPDGKEMGGPAADNDHFILYEQGEKSWLDWSPEIMLNGGAGETGGSGTPQNNAKSVIPVAARTENRHENH
jgi:paraquat-inducible protein B